MRMIMTWASRLFMHSIIVNNFSRQHRVVCEYFAFAFCFRPAMSPTTFECYVLWQAKCSGSHSTAGMLTKLLRSWNSLTLDIPPSKLCEILRCYSYAILNRYPTYLCNSLNCLDRQWMLLEGTIGSTNCRLSLWPGTSPRFIVAMCCCDRANSVQFGINEIFRNRKNLLVNFWYEFNHIYPRWEYS